MYRNETGDSRSHGSYWRQVVEAALHRGREVTVLVRRSGSFSPFEGLREVVWTDFSDGLTLESALIGARGDQRPRGRRDSRLLALLAAVWAGVADRMLDKETMKSLITSSSLRWTIVRPPALKDLPATGHYEVDADLPIRLRTSIGRADLAAFLVREVEQAEFVRTFWRVAR